MITEVKNLNLMQISILIKSAPYCRDANKLSNIALKRMAYDIALDNVHPSLMRKVYVILNEYSEDTLRDVYFILEHIDHA